MSDLNVSSDGAAAPAWRERKNLLLGGAVGFALLLLAAYFLVFSGGSSSEDTGLVVSGKDRIASNGGPAAKPSASASASSTAATTLPATFDEDIYGDPFAPLYPAAPTAAPSTEAPAAPVVPVGGAPVDTSNAAPVEEPAPANTARTTTSLRLIRVVDQETVIVATDGSKSQNVFKIGVAFGNFVLVGTRPDEDEATFKYGDALFTMTENETRKFTA